MCVHYTVIFDICQSNSCELFPTSNKFIYVHITVYFETLFYAQKTKKNRLKIVLISKSTPFDSRFVGYIISDNSGFVNTISEICSINSNFCHEFYLIFNLSGLYYVLSTRKSLKSGYYQKVYFLIVVFSFSAAQSLFKPVIP